MRSIIHRLNNPPDLLKMIIYHTSRYYQVETTAQPNNLIESSEAMYISIEPQNNIDWNHFLRRIITKLFQPVVRSYFRRNKIPPKFSGRYWTRHMIKALLNLHYEEWQIYCSITHEPIPHIKNSALVREYLLTLVSKYFTLAYNLPTSKRKRFSTKIEKIQLWRDNEIKRWLTTAKRLIRKYQLKSSPIINSRNSGNRISKQQLYTGINKYKRTQHRIIKLPSPAILNKRKVMKMNTYFPSQKSLATNQQNQCQRPDFNIGRQMTETEHQKQLYVHTFKMYNTPDLRERNRRKASSARDNKYLLENNMEKQISNTQSVPDDTVLSTTTSKIYNILPSTTASKTISNNIYKKNRFTVKQQ